MTLAVPGNKSPCDEGLILACEAHLVREESLLSGTLESLQAVRAAIISADWENLPELLGFQTRLETDSRDMAHVRDSLRERIASSTGIAVSEVTLRAMTTTVPPARATLLLEGRERLVRMVRDAESLRRTIVTLVRYSLGFHQKMLEGLTGRGGWRPRATYITISPVSSTTARAHPQRA